MATLFSHLRFPPLREGPRDYRDFKYNFIDTLIRDPFALWGWAVASPVLGTIFAIGLSDHANLTVCIAVAVGFVWLCVSGCPFLSYASTACDHGGMSLVWLPWRQPWTWALVVITLPWLPFWVISALRLLITRNKIRPDPLPIKY